MSEIIVNTSQTRSLEQLNEEEKKQVETKLASLDYMDPVSIIKFGSESSKEVTSISTEMISKFKVRDFEDAQALITNLIGDLKTVDPDTLLTTKKKGVLSMVPFVGKKAEEKITKLLTQQVSIEKAIDEVEDKLVAAKVTIMGDMEFCSEMIKKHMNMQTIRKLNILQFKKLLRRQMKKKSS